LATVGYGAVVAEWSILADDRTGALDAAGEMARWLGPMLVASHPQRATVVDLGSRVLTAPEAAAAVRAASADAPVHLHKIDSMLRGNWCAELIARGGATTRRVLMVPAWPAMHRTCRHGMVVADGTAVGRPAAQFAARGGSVSQVDLSSLDGWVGGVDPVAVCDATDEGELAGIARWWVDHCEDVVLAGPAGVLAAAAAEWRGGREPLPVAGPPRLPAPVVVVCASVHPTARAQVDAVRRARPNVTVVASPLPADGPPAENPQVDPSFVERWFDRADAERAGTLVLIGGDTAAAVMGPGRWTCSGTIGPGVAVARRVDGTGPVYVTKAGAFGDESTLVRVIDMVGDQAAG
jgi:uncharacterized protein YgbK (DUF1537 family)